MRDKVYIVYNCDIDMMRELIYKLEISHEKKKPLFNLLTKFKNNYIGTKEVYENEKI